MTKIQSILALVFGAVVNLSLVWHFFHATLIADKLGTSAAQSYLDGLTPLYLAVPLAGLALWLAPPDRAFSKQ